MVEAALAAAGLGGCTLQPPQRALPYVVPPDQPGVASGDPLYYATSMPYCGYGLGILGKCVAGRPIKVDGLADHPSTLGKSSLALEASVLSLYDPDRSRYVLGGGVARSWSDCLTALRAVLANEGQSGGAGIRILTETVTSPTLAAEIAAFLGDYPAARWYRSDPLGDDAALAGAERAFGRVVEPVLRLRTAKRILTLDADLFAGSPGSIRNAFDYGRGRDVTGGRRDMNRLYVVESSPTVTGQAADHRLAVGPSQVAALARALASRILGGVADAQESKAFIDAAARDLLANKGAAVVVAGRGASAEVHALTHAMNAALDAPGKTVDYIDPVDYGAGGHAAGLEGLVNDLLADKVTLLLILDANPVYHAPTALEVGAAIARAKVAVHLGPYVDETARVCHWHAPVSHYLEAWGDLRAHDGTVSLQQPLVRPLVDGRTPAELVAALRSPSAPGGYEILRRHWAKSLDADGFRRAIHDGLVAGSTAPSVATQVRPDVAALAAAPASAASTAIELVVRPDPTVGDGRYANNGWLQEAPKPFLTLTWENAAILAPATASRIGLSTGDVVRVARGAAAVEGPVLVMPGAAEDTLTLTLGYGRRAGGRWAEGRGVDTAPLRTSANPWGGVAVTVEALGRVEALALTEKHHRMEGRHPVQWTTLDELETKPDELHDRLSVGAPRPDETLFPPMPAGQHAWGMTIDLNQCIGCNACVVACQSENNIPVVGKEQVLLGRQMHWLRVDRYFDGPPAAPEVSLQPVPCMHCEQAPCEVVCPVEATLHGRDGLNEMVYNRCVGTRYCSNNCPYKVRRFNFLQYSPARDDPRTLVHNPDVSVRPRGVMEKCTYCIQRIAEARIAAEREGRPITDGEVVPACAAACPTEAITFGDLKDERSRVSIFKTEPRNYALLAELNTRPRTTYLAGVRNRNPELGGGE
jgi:molybdopterin-containing oxidoreductase family iron-sulfur binding subunit